MIRYADTRPGKLIRPMNDVTVIDDGAPISQREILKEMGDKWVRPGQIKCVSDLSGRAKRLKYLVDRGILEDRKCECGAHTLYRVRR